MSAACGCILPEGVVVCSFHPPSAPTAADRDDMGTALWLKEQRCPHAVGYLRRRNECVQCLAAALAAVRADAARERKVHAEAEAELAARAEDAYRKRDALQARVAALEAEIDRHSIALVSEMARVVALERQLEKYTDPSRWP